jgi:site-specific DNA-methyltransferase (adenine-specific)
MKLQAVKWVEFDGGLAVLGDSTQKATRDAVLEKTGQVPLIIADPPYGNILKENWDTADDQSTFVRWMFGWTNLWAHTMCPGGAFYVWGGIGRPNFRPFFEYMSVLEKECSPLEISNLVTWSKRRGYGVQNNYLFTREELVYLVNGNAKKPRMFNVPYLEQKRGYPGYNKKYPAKSEHKRRTNVWTDVTEIMRGKVHVAQKPTTLHKIIVGVHTEPGEWVVDPFAGSGVTALAAREMGRRWIVIENDPASFDTLLKRLK